MLSAKDVKYKKFIGPIMEKISEEIDKHVREEPSYRTIQVYDIGYHDEDIIEEVKNKLEEKCFFDIEYTKYYSDSMEQYKLSFRY